LFFGSYVATTLSVSSISVCAANRAPGIALFLIDRASNALRIRGVTQLPWFRHVLVHAGALAWNWMRDVRVDLLGAVVGFDYNDYQVPGIATACV
jgi:hypothetical protein